MKTVLFSDIKLIGIFDYYNNEQIPKSKTKKTRFLKIAKRQAICLFSEVGYKVGQKVGFGTDLPVCVPIEFSFETLDNRSEGVCI